MLRKTLIILIAVMALSSLGAFSWRGWTSTPAQRRHMKPMLLKLMLLKLTLLKPLWCLASAQQVYPTPARNHRKPLSPLAGSFFDWPYFGLTALGRSSGDRPALGAFTALVPKYNTAHSSALTLPRSSRSRENAGPIWWYLRYNVAMVLHGYQNSPRHDNWDTRRIWNNPNSGNAPSELIDR